MTSFISRIERITESFFFGILSTILFDVPNK